MTAVSVADGLKCGAVTVRARTGRLASLSLELRSKGPQSEKSTVLQSLHLLRPVGNLNSQVRLRVTRHSLLLNGSLPRITTLFRAWEAGQGLLQAPSSVRGLPLG